MAAGDSFMFTVGKVDAGMAILIGERAHLIEFPSILLPSGCTSGSIVNIAVHRNLAEEKKQSSNFWNLQDEILQTFGVEEPKAPKLELRNVTQTSITFEWAPLQLSTSKLLSLSLHKNSQRLSTIPSPLSSTSTKLSSLQIDTEYTFQLILRTTAGTYPSNIVKVRTHKMSDTSGISVCFGELEEGDEERVKGALGEMGARWSERVQVETTHFVCRRGEKGVEYQRALQMSIPVVLPEWVLACHREKKMVKNADYYLGTTPPPLPSQTATQSQSRQTLDRDRQQRVTSPTSPTKQSSTSASVPVISELSQAKPQRHSPPSTAFVNQSPNPNPPAPISPVSPTSPTSPNSNSPPNQGNATQKGRMNPAFKFPSPTTEHPPTTTTHVHSISTLSIPASPPAVERGRIGEREGEEEDDGEVGETVEVDLS